MEIIYVVHVIKYNLRHMPEFYHVVGNLQQIRDEILGLGNLQQFDYACEVISFANQVHKERGYQIVHSYEAIK